MKSPFKKNLFKKKQEEKKPIIATPTKEQAIAIPKVVVKPPMPRQRVWHISWLRTFKRVLAAMIFLVNVFFLLGSLTSGLTIWATLYFLGIGFITLDYLWKTKRVKVIFD